MVLIKFLLSIIYNNMQLPFFNKKQKTEEKYLAIFLKETKGIVIILEKNNYQLTIKDKENFSYTNGWENLTDDIDEIIFQLEKRSNEKNFQLKKTIFFVYSHLVDEKTGEIKKPYLEKIKQLVKDLGLEAIGYIEVHEGVNYFLEKKEEIQLTSVLLELDETQLTFFVYKSGKLEYKKTVARTNDIIEDFIEVGSQIKGKIVFPSRIIIYDSDNLDDTAALLISHRWEKDYFIQMPKITILKEEDLIEGLIMVFSSQIKQTNQQEQPKEKKEEKKETFGFLIGEDIEEKAPIFHESKKRFQFQLPSFVFKLPVINLPKINLDFFKGRLAIFIGFLTIILAIFLNEYFFHQTHLTVFLPSKTIEKKLIEVIDFKTASVSAEFTDSIATSGKKDIGDKAKGTVTIHNFDDQEKNFSKGTILTALNSNLKYTLDTDIKVASSTLTVDGSAKLPGKADVAITALDIGPEYNLEKGQKFKINDLSTNTYFAINNNNLTGGNKKQIRTVSSIDIANLEKNILEKAKKENKQPSFPKNYLLLPDLYLVDFIDKKYSLEIGEEADSVSLKAKIESTYFAYDKDELLNLLYKELISEFDNNYQLSKDNIFYKIDNLKKDDKLKINLSVKAKAIKKIDEKQIIKKIKGKKQKDLEMILKNNFQINGFEIINKDSLPIINEFLPFFEKNIDLKISSL